MKKIIALLIISILLLSGMLVEAGSLDKNDKNIYNQNSKFINLSLPKLIEKLLDFIFERFPLLEEFLRNYFDLPFFNSDFEDGCIVSLPEYPILADIEEINGIAPLYSYLSTELSGISGFYSVDNIVYPGWCVDYHTPLPFGDPMPIFVMLYSSYCPPDDLISDGWDEVNYILNHKHPSASWGNIHRAINYFVGFGDSVPIPVEGSPGDQMVKAALLNPNWMPTAGDVVAVIVDPIEELIEVEFPDDEYGPHNRWQYTIIEVPVPERYEGCTPGFWKNKKRFSEWTSPYDPDDQLKDVFNIAPFFPSLQNDELIDALKYNGGKNSIGMARNLLRGAVAAVLNAAHPEINYPIDNPLDVINMVNTALSTKNRDTMENLKDELDMYNNFGYDEWW